MEEVQYGVIGSYGYFSLGQFEIILPINISVIIEDPFHQIIKKIIEKIRIVVGFAFEFGEKEDNLIIADSNIFHDNKDLATIPLKWNIRTESFITNEEEENEEKGLNGEKIFNKIAEIFTEFFIRISRKSKKYSEDSINYGVIGSYGFFSSTQYEMILPIDTSVIIKTPLHQQIKKMIEQSNAFVGLAFEFNKEKENIILVDDDVFGDLKIPGFEWFFPKKEERENREERDIIFQEINEIKNEIKGLGRKVEKISEEKLERLRERAFQNLLIHFPEIIEPNLKYLDREYRLGDSYFRGDILFLDSNSKKLNVEVKVKTPSKERFREQLMNYKNNTKNERIMYLTSKLTVEEKEFCKKYNIEPREINIHGILRW